MLYRQLMYAYHTFASFVKISAVVIKKKHKVYRMSKQVKLSQAVEANWFVRRRGSHIF
jgi:hypothetical protein